MEQIFKVNEKKVGFVYEKYQGEPSYYYFKYDDPIDIRELSLAYKSAREKVDSELANEVAKIIGFSGIKYNLKGGIGWEFEEKETLELIKKAEKVLEGKEIKEGKEILPNEKSKKLAEATYRFQQINE